MGAYNHTHLLAPRPPEKDLPRQPLASLGAEHWLPMVEGADVCMTYSNGGLSCSNIGQIDYKADVRKCQYLNKKHVLRVRSTQTLVEIYNA